tara:strand:- start:9860 stop:10087 length:228 start_codon:yes stop_codon:yes gene_type:complete
MNDDDLYPVFEDDWYASLNMGIQELRMLYSHIEYSIKMWPGAPARPVEEQEYLQRLKSRIASVIMQYNFDMLEME